MKVLKFGGSSVATPERILTIVDILQKYKQRGDQFTVIFSAFGGVTDALIEMGRLASAGDESYETNLEDFRNRHLDAARALLDSNGFSDVEKDINEIIALDSYKESLKFGGAFIPDISKQAQLDFVNANALAYVKQ